MSNSKWLKLFKILSENHQIIEACRVKNIHDEMLRKLTIPPLEQFPSTFFEKGIRDVMQGGPTSFHGIELIEVTTKKAAEHLEEVLSKRGQFETAINGDTLTIYGYKY